MAKFFNYFPKTLYTNANNTSSLNNVTNIISRFKFEDSLKENSSAFYYYEIKDSDTPEIIARKFYDHVERHWIVLLYNNIVDPQYDWPLEYRTLINYIDEKYSASEYADTANTSNSGISWAQSVNNVQAYFKVITSTISDTITVEKFEVDANTYANNTVMNIGTTNYTLQNDTNLNVKITKETRTHYDYEVELNEKKRKIKLLKKEFVPQIEKEFKRVLR